MVLTGDLIDQVKPGDEIEIVAIYKADIDINMQNKYGFPLCRTYLECNSINKINEIEETMISQEDKIFFNKLKFNEHLVDIMVNSVAPSIYGHRIIKLALILALFGG